MTPEERIREHLRFLYGEERTEEIWLKMEQIMVDFRSKHPRMREQAPAPSELLSEKDAILITYGDQISAPEEPPLKTLADFSKEYLQSAINGIHILPFFPYSSDDGFSVIDYREVNPDMGTWEDIDRLDEEFRLMFDAVINHISRESDWFKGYVRGNEPYTDYFIEVDPDTDLSMVVRPRATPLLTKVETNRGTFHVWTTFSDDQIDLDFSNPDVLLEITDLLLFYVDHGAEIIRLDAIAYLWKEIGTSCIHLPQTHAVVKLWRAVLDAVAPQVILNTETNVPHEENISYFGEKLPDSEKTDEAQMVYQFPLAPLAVHSFLTHSAVVLSEWAASLETPTEAANFFNFIASHDGIGVMPARGLLAEEEIQFLVDITKAHGGEISYKMNQDGSRSVYELNITLYDLLNDPKQPDPEIDIRRFLSSQVVMLSLAGVPGIYVHSLFGSRNCYTCLEETGRARSINREKFRKQPLVDELADVTSRRSKVFSGYMHLLRTRREHKAFHPTSSQHVLRLGESLFALVRGSQEEEELILSLVNVSDQKMVVKLVLDEHSLPQALRWRDLIGGGVYPTVRGEIDLPLEAFQSMWLIPEE